MNEKVLVLDLTHGGEVLAREFASRGDSVTAVDVYHTATAEKRDALIAEGVRVLDSAPREEFDLGVVPVHCPDRFIGPAVLSRRITAHRAVGELASFDVPVVEFTGVRGKTSACHVLAHVLARTGERVLVHTSRGQFSVAELEWKMLKDKVSIAPPSILSLAREHPPCDVGVFEVSLGGTGLADVSVITGLDDDYPIAGGTRRAFDGKVQMARTARKLVCPVRELELWAPHVPDGADLCTFGPGGDLEISLPDRLELGKGVLLTVRWKGEEYQVRLPGTFLAPSYTTALASGLAAAGEMGVDMERAVSSLASFKGVPGRGDVTREGGKFLIKERNPGVSAGSIDWNLGVLERHYSQEDIGIALDPVNIKVCEKLDIGDVDEVLSRHPSVKGQYIINMPGLGRTAAGYLRIDGPGDVRGKHEVLMHCIKEGYL
ncbi:MAG: coenzyme F430 synthase [Methanomassiliicoccus sp.]|nr:coenzyme F430 synthase [Methanomassiliicoccus sp.]